MNLLISICARGGSKGIPKKNIRPVAGQPLIAYSIQTARKLQKELSANVHTKLVLSTEDDQIKNVASDHGLETDYTRPAHLANDTVGKIDVLKDLFLYHCKADDIDYDLMLDLDVTSPLRTVQDLLQALKVITSDSEALNLFSVSPAQRNPYFNMVEVSPEGYAVKCKNLDIALFTRQSSPKVYDLNASFYYYKKSFLKDDFTTVYTPRSIAYEVPHVCFDVDEMIDLEILDFLLSHKKLDFQI